MSDYTPEQEQFMERVTRERAAAPAMYDLLREARAHLRSLAVPGRTLYGADCNAIEARARDIDRALTRIDGDTPDA